MDKACSKHLEGNFVIVLSECYKPVIFISTVRRPCFHVESNSWQGQLLSVLLTQMSHNQASITNATHWQLLKTVCVSVCVRAGYDKANPKQMQYKTLHRRGPRCWTPHTRLCDGTCRGSESRLERDLRPPRWFHSLSEICDCLTSWGWYDCDTDALCSIDLHLPDFGSLMFVLCHLVLSY